MNGSTPDFSSASTTAEGAGERRILELDGLRGIAILLVIWHHFTVISPQSPVERWLVFTSHFGWIGVDLFFVLSGFLITGILLDARASPRYFRSFYARRVLRIFPLYYALLFAVLVMLPLAMPARWESAGMQSDYDWTYWVFLSNFMMAAQNAFTNRILAPTWSLAIEEQFYVLWPLVVWLMGPRGLLRLCPLLVVGSLLVRFAMIEFFEAGNTSVYVFTLCRLDALAAGAWVATSLRSGGGATCHLQSLKALAVTTLAAAYLGESWVALHSSESIYHRTEFGLIYGISLLAIGFAAVVMVVVGMSGQRATKSWLTNPVLRSFGKYSFAIYLTHMPLRAMLRDRVLGPNSNGSCLLAFSDLSESPWVGQACFFVLALVSAWTVGWLSWHLYERWFLRLKRHFPY